MEPGAAQSPSKPSWLVHKSKWEGTAASTSSAGSWTRAKVTPLTIETNGGVLAMLYAAITSLTRKPVEARRIVVDVTVWYWHFMALLWLYIFALLEFAR